MLEILIRYICFFFFSQVIYMLAAVQQFDAHVVSGLMNQNGSDLDPSEAHGLL